MNMTMSRQRITRWNSGVVYACEVIAGNGADGNMISMILQEAGVELETAYRIVDLYKSDNEHRDSILSNFPKLEEDS